MYSHLNDLIMFNIITHSVINVKRDYGGPNGHASASRNFLRRLNSQSYTIILEIQWVRYTEFFVCNKDIRNQILILNISPLF